MAFLIEQEIANSAMMGAAYRAKIALLKNEHNFEDVLKILPDPSLICEPYDDADSVSVLFEYIVAYKITFTVP